MKNFVLSLCILISSLLIISCRVNLATEEKTVPKSSQNASSAQEKTTPESIPEVADTVIVKRITKEIFTSLKNREFELLATYFHPDLGVRFSSYAFINIGKDVKLSAKEYAEGIKSNKTFTWGYAQGSGDPIDLSISEYLKTFVYDADFLNAANTSVNKMIGTGNTPNNLREIYPGAIFTESYDPGKQEMAWKSLRLVFKKAAGKFYLIGIVHDQWTI